MPKSVTPSDEQARAIAEIVAWYKGGSKSKQVFYLAGYAGTGKSTVYEFVRAALRPIGAREVITCAFTGKAAHVLRKKGTQDAMTIHAAIYSPVEDPETGETTFKLNEFGVAGTADLIGLDECSMVDDEMALDLMSFKKKILVMGDPGQLPPIRGPGAFTKSEPDVFLHEIHRQAAESPIIRLATLARQGERIGLGEYGSARVLQLNGRTQHEVYAPDTMALCGVHRVRHTITQRYRNRLGFDGNAPLPGERLICCRNDHRLGIFNGGLASVIASSPMPSGNHRMDIEIDDLDAPIWNKVVSAYHFDQHFGPVDRPRSFKGTLEFDWGYILTAHKAQGSEWPHVTVVDDSGAFREDARKWLYTAITRASEGLTLLRRE